MLVGIIRPVRTGWHRPAARRGCDRGYRWLEQVQRWSLGWVIARDEDGLVGFVNVPWDGLIHAFIIDPIVATRARRTGVGRRLIRVAAEEASAAGCEWLHVDFDDELASFYLEACGFEPTQAGLIKL